MARISQDTDDKGSQRTRTKYLNKACEVTDIIPTSARFTTASTYEYACSEQL